MAGCRGRKSWVAAELGVLVPRGRHPRRKGRSGPVRAMVPGTVVGPAAPRSAPKWWAVARPRLSSLPGRVVVSPLSAGLGVPVVVTSVVVVADDGAEASTTSRTPQVLLIYLLLSAT